MVAKSALRPPPGEDPALKNLRLVPKNLTIVLRKPIQIPPRLRLPFLQSLHQWWVLLPILTTHRRKSVTLAHLMVVWFPRKLTQVMSIALILLIWNMPMKSKIPKILENPFLTKIVRLSEKMTKPKSQLSRSNPILPSWLLSPCMALVKKNHVQKRRCKFAITIFTVKNLNSWTSVWITWLYY